MYLVDSSLNIAVVHPEARNIIGIVEISEEKVSSNCDPMESRQRLVYYPVNGIVKRGGR